MLSEKLAPRVLIWITLALFITISSGIVIAARSKLPPPVAINYIGHPTIGYTKAKIHVVVFEEPKCSNCREYSETIFPKIKKEFIDTNKITYTVIPVSFLPGSMNAAMALLCVYNADPLYPNSELFFDYLDYVYKNQPSEKIDWATTEKLIEMAQKTSPAINPSQLKKCIDMQTYRVKIQKNTEYGKKVMGGTISTPTVFVNGIEVQSLTYSGVRDLINEVAKEAK